jgi:hypothetical protein
MQRTFLDEIFREYEMQETETAGVASELGWELTEAELHELSNIFSRLKNFARRKYNQAKPLIVAGRILAKVISPGATDVATYIESQRNRYRDTPAIVEKGGYTDKPK